MAQGWGPVISMELLFSDVRVWVTGAWVGHI